MDPVLPDADTIVVYMSHNLLSFALCCLTVYQGWYGASCGEPEGTQLLTFAAPAVTEGCAKGTRCVRVVLEHAGHCSMVLS